MEIRVGVSNRHIHLTKKDYEILFGENTRLTKRNDLTQDGEFATNEVVTIKTNANLINNVRLLGPLREYTQVEISKTDSYFLKIDPPYRDSGDLEGSESLTIIGPKGKIDKKNCCIIPVRHIHVNNVDDTYKDKEVVKVLVEGSKGGIINNVYIKKGKGYHFELHLDTDDANSHNLKTGDTVTIVE